MPENVTTYLTLILTDNENLKNHLTNYLNLKVSTQATYGTLETDLSKAIKPEEKKSLIDTISMFRAYATRIKISLNVLKNKFNPETYKQVEQDYETIKTQPLPEYDIC